MAYRPDLRFNRTAAPLDTTSWRSYALFAAGEIAQREGRRADARRAFERALDDDPANLGARLNLGALLLQPAPGLDGYPHEDDGAATERLGTARSLLENVNTRATEWATPLPYRSRYLAAIGDLYANLPDHALQHINVLKDQISANRHIQTLEPILGKLKFAVDALSLSANVLKGVAPDFSQFQDDWMPVAAEYNLACVYNRWASRPHVPSRHARSAVPRLYDISALR